MTGAAVITKTATTTPWTTCPTRLFGVVTLSCLGISGGFELAETLTGALTGQAGTAYLGTQGDALDPQWDMTCALVGAVTTQLPLAPVHDRQVARLGRAGAPG